MSSPRILGAWQVHNGRFPKGSQAKNVTQTAIGGGSRWTTNNADCDPLWLETASVAVKTREARSHWD